MSFFARTRSYRSFSHTESIEMEHVSTSQEIENEETTFLATVRPSETAEVIIHHPSESEENTAQIINQLIENEENIPLIPPQSSENEENTSLTIDQPSEAAYEAAKGLQEKEGRNISTTSSEATKKGSNTSPYGRYNSRTVKFLVIVVGVVLALSVTVCLLFSQLTFLKIIITLYEFSNFSNISITESPHDAQKRAAQCYWQLLFIMWIPNIVTFVRAVYNGVFSNATNNPWPHCCQLILMIFHAIIEATSETGIVFIVLVAFPPEVVLLYVNTFTAMDSFGNCCLSASIGKSYFDSFENCHWQSIGSSCLHCFRDCCQECNAVCCLNSNGDHCAPPLDRKIDKYCVSCEHCESCECCKLCECCNHCWNWICFSAVCCLKLLQIILPFFQFLFAASAVVLMIISAQHPNIDHLLTDKVDYHAVFIPTLSLFLALSWISKVQDFFNKVKSSTHESIHDTSAREHGHTGIEERRINDGNDDNTKTARWKANLITSFVRFAVYPFVSLIAFRFFYITTFEDHVNPWGHYWFDPSSNVTIAEAFQWRHEDLQVFLVHVFVSFAGYWLSWISCFMGLHVFGLAIPVIFAPMLVFVYYIPNADPLQGPTIFPFEGHYNSWLIHNSVEGLIIAVLAFSSGALVLQCLSYMYKLCKKGNGILATDADMFYRPYYNSMFLALSLIVNRRAWSSTPKQNMQTCKHVYICSTMYHETKQEMNDFLNSISNVAESAGENAKSVKFESHVFFDNGCRVFDSKYRGYELSGFSLQFLTLLLNHEIFHQVLHTKKMLQTPYGLQWEFQLNNGVKFVVHFKDNQRARKKKRWSQVMYMNYVIKHKLQNESKEVKENSYILTTDGDVEFKLKSINTLLDMIERNSNIGGVCARTYPKGSGLLYWYQVFDYAAGHWLQKPAEQIFGCVLCCPGCFSIFKCSALEECLKTYSGAVENAQDFLCKDMGEDRWLTTLLIDKGFKMEYCAISSNHTHCPDEFEEFFKQRRRWIPSTVANQVQILSNTLRFRKRNDFVTIFFLFYQFLLLFSTAIAPATVILLISSGVGIFRMTNNSTFGQVPPTSNVVFDIFTILINTVLGLICVAFGILCIKASQTTQLKTAKILTFFFSILMALSFSSLAAGIIINVVSGFESLGDKPGSPFYATTIYVIVFTAIFFITALLHFHEVVYLAYSIIYFLGLPGAYIFLLIFAAANLNSQSWGTREGKDKEHKTFFDHPWVFFLNGLVWFRDHILQVCQVVFEGKHSRLHLEESGTSDGYVSNKTEDHVMGDLEDEADSDGEDQGDDVGEDQADCGEDGSDQHMDKKLCKWLRKELPNDMEFEKIKCLFEKAGYTRKCFVSTMTEKDLRDIGIESLGCIRHLAKAVRDLPAKPISAPINSVNVAEWLEENDLKQFQMSLEAAGYYQKRGLEFLQFIDAEELTKCGITLRAHQQYLLSAFKSTSDDVDEKEIAHTRRKLEGMKKPKHICGEEATFWKDLCKQLEKDSEQVEDPEEYSVHAEDEFKRNASIQIGVLYPTKENPAQQEKLGKDLRKLRNSVLIGLLLTNVIWMVIMTALVIPQLRSYYIESNIAELLFLSVYLVVLILQFVTMLVHRLISLSHNIGRVSLSCYSFCQQRKKHQPEPLEQEI